MLYSMQYQLYINSASHFLYIENLTANMAAGVLNREVVDVNSLTIILKFVDLTVVSCRKLKMESHI
jgi:hypothetical protein